MAKTKQKTEHFAAVPDENDKRSIFLLLLKFRHPDFKFKTNPGNLKKRSVKPPVRTVVIRTVAFAQAYEPVPGANGYP